jgi:hypothetical protein
MRPLSTAAPALAIALLAAPGSRADACKPIETSIVTRFALTECNSPVGVCTTGSVASGRLQGTTTFMALTMVPGAQPDTVLYTGLLTVNTKSGSVILRDYGILNSATGEYFEVQQVVDGTRAFKHATGTLTSRGLATGTGFSGDLNGALCPGKN